jgi:hypothetical protein
MTTPEKPEEPSGRAPEGWTSVPLPPQAAREMEACAAIDRLRIALEAARMAMDAVHAAASQLPEDAPVPDVR